MSYSGGQYTGTELLHAESSERVDSPTSSATIAIDDLPDEVLENIFSRLSPYQDLDSVCAVCQRWNHLAKGTIQGLKSHFLQSILNGKLECIIQPSVTENQIAPAWPQERFGQIACYHDKSLYIVGGSTHRKTTFNDMWKLDLGTRIWSRIISRGNYPSPKAFASCGKHKDTIYMFGGWTHASSSPLMTPWRLFDELHRYNFTTNTWAFIVGTSNPPPTAGHSCTIFGDEMVIFGGRTYDIENQRYPVCNDVWVFDFNAQDWYKVSLEDSNNAVPAPRYGQTQTQIDESHILIIGGCDGPMKIFNDVWLLVLRTDPQNRTSGSWRQLTISDPVSNSPPLGFQFHYSGCRVGDSVVFFQQFSSLSPYMTFLHFDCYHLPPIYQQMVFEESRDSFQNGRRSLPLHTVALKSSTSCPTMPLYSLDISRVLFDQTVCWRKEVVSCWTRPEERFLYSIVAGRSEIILFGGFFKEPNGRRCRVSSDVFILRTVPKTY